MVEVMKKMVTTFKRSHTHIVPFSAHGRPPQTHASARDSRTFMSKSELVSCGSLLLSPGSWCAQGSV